MIRKSVHILTFAIAPAKDGDIPARQAIHCLLQCVLLAASSMVYEKDLIRNNYLD